MEECSARHRWTRIPIRSVFLLGFADQLSQTTGCRLSDERFTASRWTIEKKPFRSGKFEPLERFRMQQWIFDGLSDGADGRVLSADLLPRNFWSFIKDMPACLAIR